MKAFVTIVILIIVITIIFTLDYYFGKVNKHNLVIPSHNSPTRKSNITLFVQGPNLFNDLFAELNNANKHIHILFYIVKNDDISKKFLQLLTKKAREGTEVVLLLDWFGSRKVSPRLLKQLKAAGGKFRYCHVPRLPYLFYTSQVRNHRKIAVIDGEIGYIGGYNIGEEYIDQDPKLSPWRDYHLKVVGEGVRDLQKQFLIDWKQAAKTDLSPSDEDRYFPHLNKGSFKHKIVPSEGVSLEKTYENLLSSAEKTIFIGTPYFIPSEKILNKLINCLKSGIEVTILVPFRADHLFVKEASHPYIRKLLKHGANIYEYINGFYHAKVMLIDNKICNIGTANFDQRSFFINYEMNCYIYDKDFIDEVVTVIEEDIAHSEKLTLDKVTNKNIIERVKEAIATIIAPFL